MTHNPDIMQALVENRCPDCSSRIFLMGPRGGLSQNIECVNCGNRFNVTRYMSQLVFAERIEREDQGGSVWP